MDNRILTRHYFISGRVQGVGFRTFAKRIADEWQMTGWTRNLADGRVEVLVLGSGDAQKAFEESMRRGPPHAEVERVEVTPADTESNPQVFEIRKDGR